MAEHTNNNGVRRSGRLRIAGWSAAAFMLTLPWIVMQFTDQVDWDAVDFIVFGAMLVSVGATYELATRITGKKAYRTAIGLALAGAFILVWANLAVGIIGSAGNSANLMFGGVSGDGFADYVTDLNERIKAAVAADREWPKFPGGLSGFLFGQESVVGKGCIYFIAENVPDHDTRPWREATITKMADGTWRITSVRTCAESEAGELIERREFLRQASIRRMGFDYTVHGPLDLLDLLRTWETDNWTSPILPFGWVKESDLPALVALLDSTEPCANVQSMLSSCIDRTRSTVGNEAAYLIEGYRKDRYPPRLNSTRPFCDIDEIKAWWKARPTG
jgi:hypothetical protein